MAVFKKFNLTKKGTRYSCGETNTGLVINPSDNTIWIDSNPYDSNTLYPLFDKRCVAFKNNKLYEEETNGFVSSSIVAKGPCLHNGQDTGVAGTNSIGQYILGSRDSNLEDDKTLQMSSSMFEFTSSGNRKFYLWSASYGGGTYYDAPQKFMFVEGNDLSNPIGVLTGTYDTSLSYDSLCFPVYVDIVNKFIYFRVNFSRSTGSTYYYRTRAIGIARASYTTNEDDGNLSIGTITNILLPNNGSVYNGGWKAQAVNSFYYCGKNLDNTLMFLESTENTSNYNEQTTAFENRSAEIFTCESYDVGSGTISTISSISTSAFTDSTVATKVMLRPRPSSFISSPISGETNVCYSYYPVANDSFEISFVSLKWDKSANSNAGSLTADNCAMTYNSGVVTDYLTYPVKSNSAQIGSQTTSNLFITEVSGSYYLHYIPSYGSPSSLTLQPALSKTLVTYEIDSTDFKNLTYHSSIQVNSLGFVHLNSARTKIGVISPGSAKIYTWNNGWSETGSETGDFVGLTQDSNGRIIGISSLADNTAATVNPIDGNFANIEHKIHLIADSLPSTVTIEFADSSLTYTGSNISTSVNVNAYNDSSARIAKSVDLKIDGANAQFTSNSSTSITTTTSTSADTNVPVTVTGPGPVTISASFSL